MSNIFTGMPMGRTPQYLKPYLDAVDGAVAIGGLINIKGQQTHTKWSLHRGGQQVGIVTIEIPQITGAKR